MTEGIEYQPTGTVDVTFDEKTYHLGRPKMRQFRYFSRKLDEQRNDLVEGLESLKRKLDDAEARYQGDDTSAEARDELDQMRAEHRALTSAPFYERTIGILAEMFDQIGDPLPENSEDWPAWLAADSSIPGKILVHWREAPKASGSNGTK